MRSFALLVLCVASGCIVGIDESALSRGGAGTNEPTEDDTHRDGATRADASVDASADAPLEEDAAPRCPGGASFDGKSAFELTIEGGTGVSCDVDDVLARDDKYAGLDRAKGAEAMLDGKLVTGCVGIELGGLVHLTGVKVRAGAVADACGATPCSTSSAEGCGTGRSRTVFAGPSREALKRVGSSVVVEQAQDLVIAFADAGADVSTIVACREGWGSDRDDIAIDYLAGVCE